MAISLNSLVGFKSTLQANYQNVSRSAVGASVPKVTQFTPFLGRLGSRSLVKEKRCSLSLSVADSNRLTTETSDEGSGNKETQQLQASVNNESGSQAFEASNGSTVSSDLKQATSPSPNQQTMPKRSPLTAKERLRAARVLNRYTESKPIKSEMGKRGLTFDFPGGFDLFLIAFSFVFISTVMFATTYIVWKVGAIHLMSTN
ncbi:hypothetical protein SLA2020_276750 [Shorea laevis]